MKTPVMVMVGGFLGSGKTTLLLRAAELLARDGVVCGIVTNDQSEGLVDTLLAGSAGIGAREVAGACFCCRFSDFVRAADGLAGRDPDVVFAEPVGSCTDLAATVLGPLQKDFAGRFRLAPYTVLVDPAFAREMSAETADPNLEYLYRTQLEEADIVCFSKADLHEDLPAIAGHAPRRLSAVTGEGIRGWLDEVLRGDLPAAARRAEVDYRRSAAAAAALGWLNWQFSVGTPRGAAPSQVAGPLVEHIEGALTAAAIRIVHLKVFARSATGWVKAALTANGGPPQAEGDLAASPASRHEVTVNLRALGDPSVLDEIVARAVARLPGPAEISHRSAFRPAAPQPERREGLPPPSAPGIVSQ
jgi:hypothetical protein